METIHRSNLGLFVDQDAFSADGLLHYDPDQVRELVKWMRANPHGAREELDKAVGPIVRDSYVIARWEMRHDGDRKDK